MERELIARALHNLSGRRERTFVKLNCAAIPPVCWRSGSLAKRAPLPARSPRKIGRFELADRGTIFLDEVGEIPLELQVKLLRVLREQEFERLGSTRTMRVNVRVIAATNRDLGRWWRNRSSAVTSYYRLKVFPVAMRSSARPSRRRHRCSSAFRPEICLAHEETHRDGAD